MTLKGPRLVLKPWETVDARLSWPLVSGAAGRRLTRLMLWEPPLNIAIQRSFVRRMRAGWRKGDPLTWAVWADGELAGSVSLHWISKEHRRAEVGLWIAPRFHRRGFGREACSLALDFAFARLGLQRVEYCYLEGNAPSAALARSLGAVMEGRFRRSVLKRGRFLDEFVCGILDDEWKKRRR